MLTICLRKGAGRKKATITKEEFNDIKGGCHQRHLCGACAYKVFIKCQKVADIHKDLLEKDGYPFIGEGIQTFDENGDLIDFYVFQCKNFRPPPQKPEMSKEQRMAMRTVMKNLYLYYYL